MFELYREFFKRGFYTIEDATSRISTALARGDITPDESVQLQTLAEQNAKENPMAVELREIKQRLAAVEATVQPEPPNASPWS